MHKNQTPETRRRRGQKATRNDENDDDDGAEEERRTSRERVQRSWWSNAQRQCREPRNAERTPVQRAKLITRRRASNRSPERAPDAGSGPASITAASSRSHAAANGRDDANEASRRSASAILPRSSSDHSLMFTMPLSTAPETSSGGRREKVKSHGPTRSSSRAQRTTHHQHAQQLHFAPRPEGLTQSSNQNHAKRWSAPPRG